MEYIETLGANAKAAEPAISVMGTNEKNRVLSEISSLLRSHVTEIIGANKLDIETARVNGMSEAMIDRLTLTEQRIGGMADGVDKVISLPDPVGAVIGGSDLPNGLHVIKKRVPIGTIGIIFESRPNVTVDAATLCFKAGNTVILRGGSDAINSNKALVGLMRTALRNCGVNENAVQLVEDTSRAVANAMMKLNKYIDLLIPRGGGGLIHAVIENATIPVIQTGEGNLGFRNTDLRSLIGARLGKQVYVENDANAAAFGEVLAGAGKGCRDVVVVTLGTGVGGGIIIDGRIYTGFNYCGAELGHTVVHYGGRPCNCGRKGCFEAYSSATALINMTKEAMEADKSSKMWEICSGDINNVDGKTAFDGWRAGDKSASGVVDMYISYLGCGLTNIVNTFQPEILLIGGGICKEGDNLTKPLEKIIAEDSYCVDPKRSTKLGICQLGNDAGIIGAAFLYTLAE